MFPELAGEFPNHAVDYPAKDRRKLKERANDKEPGAFVYEDTFDLPYGTFDIKLMFASKNKPIEEVEMKPLPEYEKMVFCDKCDPVPRSMDQLR